MAGALPFIAMGMQAIGTIHGVAEESRGLRAAARVDDENARLAILSGAQDGSKVRREERRETGTMIAQQGLSGTLVGTDSNLRAVEQNAFQRELELLNIRTRAQRESDNYKAAAAEKRKQAKAAIVRGVLGAAAQGFAAASDISNRKKVEKQNEKRRQSERGGYGTGYGG